MTSEQLDDILAKADAVYEAKAAHQTAEDQYNAALTSAANAAAAWHAGVLAGESEENLTDLVTAYVATAVTAAEKDAAQKAARTPYLEASLALEAATAAVIQEALTPP